MKVLFALFALVALTWAVPQAPVFADKYKLTCEINFWDFNLAVPTVINFDQNAAKVAQWAFNGRQKQLYDLNEMTLYSAVPAKDKLTCFKQLALGGPNYLPNLEWKYVQDVEFRGIKCHKYAFTKDTESQFIAVELYTRQYTQEPVAVAMPKMTVHVYKYEPNVIDPAAFEVPEICKDQDLIEEEASPVLGMPQIDRMVKNIMDNDMYIRKMNAQQNGDDKMVLGHNAFSHLSWEEFKGQMLHDMDASDIPTPPSIHETPSQNAIDALPKEVDWERTGHVTRVKNQAACGGCWSFSAITALETQYAKKYNGKLVGFSEQNLMDCAWGNYSNNGCWGGLQPRAFQYLLDEQQGRVAYDALYPFEMTNGYCRINKSPELYVPNFRFKSWTQIEEGDYHSIEEAVAKVGSISVAIKATRAFQLYTGGMFTDTECDEGSINHAVTIVGYGTTASGQKYWKLKNSWGENWGVDGYFYFPRGVNKCLVESLASYPVM